MNMNQMEIEKLIDKYFECETSLEEEKYIIQYFQNEIIPENLLIYKQIFNIINILKNEEIQNPEFDRKLLIKLDKSSKTFKIKKFRSTFYYISGIAATFLIFIILFFSFKKNDKIEKITKSNVEVIENKSTNRTININNPEEAYRITLKTLHFISKSMNNGTKNLNKLSALNKGIEEASKISKFEEYQKVIINN
jgi:hypothetical protein